MDIKKMNTDQKRQFLKTALSEGFEAAEEKFKPSLYVIGQNDDGSLFDPVSGKEISESQAQKKGEIVIYLDRQELDA